jgi:hypothetical protein
VREAFLNCFKWEPVDGQHIRSACVDIATEAMDAGTLTAKEYDSVFSKWKAQVVLYDELQLYVELPSTATDTEEIVARRAAFYGTLFACIGIPQKKEEYKFSELRTLFEVHLRFACME